MINILNSLKRRIRNFAAPASEPASYAEVERAEQIFYLEYLREGMTVFDVGANVGELTLLFSRFTAGGAVHAFEPSRAAFEKLEAVCRAANRQTVVLNNLALSDKNGFVRLHVYEDNYLSFNSQAARPLKDYGLNLEPVGIEEIASTIIAPKRESSKSICSRLTRKARNCR
jgi:FkbM family methyltransferase